LIDNDLQAPPAESAAQTTARDPEIDPDRAQVVTAWPALPDAIRAGVLALVKATVGDGRKGAKP